MVEGNWIFGMIERRQDGQIGRFRIEICPDNVRTEEVLVGLIRKHVGHHTVIPTDGWASYQNLERYGYGHRTVIHEREFVDPVTGCHINTIESSWRAVKHHIARGGIADLGMHLCEFLFMKEMRRLNMDLFDGLITAIADVSSLDDNDLGIE